MSAPALPDGFVAVVKRDCETCRTVVPALRELDAAADLTVYTQDDPTFPGDPAARFDADLAVSWHHDIETVPTLIRVVDGVETERIFGWLQREWREFTGIGDLGEGLPAMRPGCGSKSVDPDLVDELAVRHGGRILRSRRIDVAEAEDDIEMMYTRGWSDGLPVVPPTEARVIRMLTGTTRAPDEIVATVPPDLVDVTVEKVAIAAVMAGCLPEHLPWVLTAVEAVCNDEFNMHGLLCTTMPVGPVLVCSGPGTRAIGMNAAGNALGQGNRANSTIGRALQLLVRNFGGGRPGEIDKATHGSPGKVGFCFAENDAESPFGRLAAEHGIEDGVDAVTVFAGEGTRIIFDQQSREPDSLARTFASCLLGVSHPKLVLKFDAMVVIGPEHARVFTGAGWGRERIVAEINGHTVRDAADLVRGIDGIAEGLPAPFGELGDVAKFREGGLMLVYAGGAAGLFSEVIGGWVNGDEGSVPVTRAVRY